MSTAMNQEERERFLAGVHVGVISFAQDGRGPLTVPIWYAYEPGGELWIVTERDSRKGKLLARTRRFSLCAQDETPPYKYVSVEGPVVTIAPADEERDIRPLAHRYLGPEMGDAYMAAMASERSDAASIIVRMRPERWSSADYAKQFDL